MKRRHVTLASQRWRVRWVTRLGKVPHSRSDKAGDCDVLTREIRVVGGLDEDEERRVLLHECIHATCPYLDEEAVDRMSDEINQALTRCGFPPVRSSSGAVQES